MFIEESLRRLTAQEVNELKREAAEIPPNYRAKVSYGLCQIYGYSNVAKDSVSGLDLLFEVFLASKQFSSLVGQMLKKKFTALEYEAFFKYARGEAAAAAAAASSSTTKKQTILAVCYLHGIGVTKNEAKAVRLFKLAAEQGYVAAQYSLGYCYQYGKGVANNKAEAVAKNKATAVELYTHAAERGYVAAQYSLGYCYLHGIGVTKNEATAVELYTQAAAQGNATAQCSLGYCYLRGIGVTKDEAKAVELYTQAAAQGLAEANQALARIRVPAEAAAATSNLIASATPPSTAARATPPALSADQRLLVELLENIRLTAELAAERTRLDAPQRRLEANSSLAFSAAAPSITKRRKLNPPPYAGDAETVTDDDSHEERSNPLSRIGQPLSAKEASEMSTASRRW